MQGARISIGNYIEPGIDWLIVLLSFARLDLDFGVLGGLDFYFEKIGREILS